jgi:hypothetical protein
MRDAATARRHVLAAQAVERALRRQPPAEVALRLRSALISSDVPPAVLDAIAATLDPTTTEGRNGG